MKILSIVTCNNQIDTLPYTIEHYQRLGTDVVVVDHYSQDGSLEYLQRRKIPYTQHDPTLCMSELKKELLLERGSHWILDVKADEFIVLPHTTLRELVQMAAEKGLNQLKCRQFNFYSTGEPQEKKHPKDQFFYYVEDLATKQVLHQESVEARSCLIEAFNLNYQPAIQGETKSELPLLDIRNLQLAFDFLVVKGDKNGKSEKNHSCQ